MFLRVSTIAICRRSCDEKIGSKNRSGIDNDTDGNRKSPTDVEGPACAPTEEVEDNPISETGMESLNEPEVDEGENEVIREVESGENSDEEVIENEEDSEFETNEDQDWEDVEDNDDEFDDEAEVDFNQMTAKQARAYLNRGVARCFFACSISFRTIESKQCRKFLKDLNRCHHPWTPPSRHHLGGDILTQVHRRIKKKKKQILQNTDGVLLLDGWRNKSNNKDLMVFTVRNLNASQTFLHAVDISDQEKTCAYIAGLIEQVIVKAKDEYGCNIYCLDNDNASNMKAAANDAAGELSDRLKLWSVTRSVTCFSHSGNLLFNHFPDADRDFFGKLHNVVITFNKSAMIKRITDLKGTRIRTYPDTRFCYLRDTIASILDNLPILRRIMATYTVQDDIRMYLQDESVFLGKCQQYLAIFNPISEFINFCQGPTANIADAVELILQLKEKMPNRDYDNLIEERIGKSVPNIAYAANLLHHKYQGSRLNARQTTKALDFIRENIDQNGLDEYDEFEFKNFPNADKCDNPIAFWLLTKNKCPNLSKFCVKVLLVPASTAMLESLFSEW